ncbi:MAG: urease subunit beta [Veillonella sp.]|uniref:urease subunit beta n=1 Tax=Veillonella sp. TaxID=1926307 RepID=UPI001B453259|nr:urease subunit beta [Veillonella sp.]MBP6923815.1 urease subunit beta [Veillonella sp.]
MKIGEVITAKGSIELNAGKDTIKVLVSNLGDRPVQVGSHFHFFEVNRCLSFDREKAFGFRLDIPSGTSVRFEPGEDKEVQLTALGGTQRVYGLNDLTRNQITDVTKIQALEQAKLKGFIK